MLSFLAMDKSEVPPPGLAHSILMISSKVYGKGDTTGAFGSFLNTLGSSSVDAANLDLSWASTL